jgi:hypothetical protein
MPSQTHSDSTLYIRFFAAIAVVLGGLSSAWNGYIALRYPVDIDVIMWRLGFTVPLFLGGLLTRLLLPIERSRLRTGWRERFQVAKVDAVMRFWLLLAIIFNVIMLPTAVSSYFDSSSNNSSFIPVQVRVESIELRHIPDDAVDKVILLKEVFHVPDLYIDLWVACGEVTILEKDGKTIDPVRSRALFTVPKREKVRTPNTPKRNATFAGSSYKYHIQHYKMDAVIDSERFEVGKQYPGWVLRNGTGDVFFSLPSDRLLRAIGIFVTFLLIPALYLLARFFWGRRVLKNSI